MRKQWVEKNKQSEKERAGKTSYIVCVDLYSFPTQGHRKSVGFWRGLVETTQWYTAPANIPRFH